MLYIIKSTIILAILLAAYHLFLEREKMHRFNRFYLLSGLILAFVTPFITVGTVDPITATQSIITFAPVVINELQSDILYDTAKGIDWLQIILYGYGIITIIMLLRFINNFITLIIKVRNNPIIHHRGHQIVLLREYTLPYTFLNNIFINQAEYESGNIEDELFVHEFAHAAQGHSFDIIAIELVHVFYWFNPLIYVYKKAIQLNHEFLADEAVVNNIKEVVSYQNLLLNKSSNSEYVYLASYFDYGATKKRLMMMTRPISRRRNIIYGLMIFPLTFFIVSCFGEYSNGNTTPIKTSGHYVYVDITKVSPEQFESVQNDLKNYDISVAFKDLEYASNNILKKFTVTADFHDGIRNKVEFDYNEFNEPYGIWKSMHTGEHGVGNLDIISMDTKIALLNKMNSLNKKGADFVIGKKNVAYKDAVKWVNKTKYWQANMNCTDKVSGRWTVQLESSISYNPLKKLKSLLDS